MPFQVIILEPVVGEPLKVEIERPEGYKLVGYEDDTTDKRYVIAFYEESEGNAKGTDPVATTFSHHATGTEHSVTAIVVQGNKVVARDRRMIRDGRVVPV